MSMSGLPGKRVDPQRAGNMATIFPTVVEVMGTFSNKLLHIARSNGCH